MPRRVEPAAAPLLVIARGAAATRAATAALARRRARRRTRRRARRRRRLAPLRLGRLPPVLLQVALLAERGVAREGEAAKELAVELGIVAVQHERGVAAGEHRQQPLRGAVDVAVHVAGCGRLGVSAAIGLRLGQGSEGNPAAGVGRGLGAIDRDQERARVLDLEQESARALAPTARRAAAERALEKVEVEQQVRGVQTERRRGATDAPLSGLHEAGHADRRGRRSKGQGPPHGKREPAITEAV